MQYPYSIDYPPVTVGQNLIEIYLKIRMLTLLLPLMLLVEILLLLSTLLRSLNASSLD